jgi:Domain of unknown function (DUF1707)
VADEPDSTREADKLRAADVDREFVAERLRTALNEGRLTLSEYDERLGQAYAARTYADLKALLTDLPEVAPPSHSKVVPAGVHAPMPVDVPHERGRSRHWVAGVWSSWCTVACILIFIWAVPGHRGPFWPAWPLGIWGAILAATTINGLASGAPHREARRRAEREARRRAQQDFRRMNGDDGTKSV